MDLILDTCGLLSLAGLGRRKLSDATLRIISQSDTVYLSACSLFEIALKEKRGSLSLRPYTDPGEFWQDVIRAYDCECLPVEATDFHDAVNLPDHHNDPFDRIIIAQAQRTQSGIVTYDRQFENYEIDLYD